MPSVYRRHYGNVIWMECILFHWHLFSLVQWMCNFFRSNWWEQSGHRQRNKCLLLKGSCWIGVSISPVQKSFTTRSLHVSSQAPNPESGIFQMNWSRPCLLMPWLLASPGHQQECYWRCFISRPLPSWVWILVSTMLADGLAPLGARLSARTMMTNIRSVLMAITPITHTPKYAGVSISPPSFKSLPQNNHHNYKYSTVPL